MNNLDEYIKSQYNEGKRDFETIEFLGGKISMMGFDILPVTCGTLSLLEILNNPFISGDINADKMQMRSLYEILYVLQHGKKCVNKLDSFDKILEKFAEKIGDIEELDLFIDGIYKTLENAGHGFELLPTKKSDPKNTYERKYDSIWLASMVSIVSNQTNLMPDEIIWELPLSSAGFYVAQYSKSQGEKDVGRKQDTKGMMDFIKAKREAKKCQN
jgi:hypothetical protein